MSLNTPGLPISQLRRLYDALLGLYEHEQTVLAELHAKDPTLLVHRFRESVKALEKVPFIDQPFYPDGRTPLPSPPTPVAQIRETHHFASQLSDGHSRGVKGGDALGFFYVDREISPLRTATTDAPRRSLDLVLGNAQDRTPIFAELKIRDDSLAYFAFVQVLMLSVELLVPAAGARVRTHVPARQLVWRDSAPASDLYIVAFEAPATGKYRDRSIQAVEEIASQLVENSLVSRYIRRIAYLDAQAENGDLSFASRFAFGEGL